MKKFLLSAATAAAALTTLSADQFYVIMKDGSVESYPTEKVDSISFNDPQIAKIMGFNEMAAELIKLKARVAALEAKSGTVDTSATVNASDLRYFVINDKEVEVVGTINGSADVVVPETALVNGKIYTVTSIAREAFKNQNRIQTVSLPKTLKNIENSAFYGCSSLTSIEIPSSVTSIGEFAFTSCRGLTKLTVPSSVVSIDRDAFYACDNLDLVIDNSRSNVECENGVIGVKSLTFTGSPLYFVVNKETNSAELAMDMIYGDHGNPNLEKVEIPSEVEIKGEKYPVTSIGEAFVNCRNLTSIKIPSSVTSIGSNAFLGCYGLTSIEIPSNVTSIGEGAFQGYSGLTKLTVPSSVTSIGWGAFSGCQSLDVVVDNSRSNVECREAFNGVNSLTFTGSPLLFRVLEDGSGVELTNSYGEVDDVYPSLKSVKIPSEVEINGKKYPVTSISRFAFGGCHNLTSIEIPSSVTSIGQEAFMECYGLTSIEIPSSVTYIGNSAFMGCVRLDVVVDNSRSNVECDYAFRSVKSVKFTGSELNFRVDEERNEAQLVGSYLREDYGGYNSIEKLSIPSEVEIKGKKYPVTSISYDAIIYDSILVSLEIPATLTNLPMWDGYEAFDRTPRLKEISVSPKNPYFSSIDGVLYNKDQTELLCIPNGKEGEVKVPSSVTMLSGRYGGDWGKVDLVIDNSRINVEDRGEYFVSCNVTFTGCPLNFYLNDENGTAAVTHDYSEYRYLESVVIPSEIEVNGKKYLVTSIEGEAFLYNSNLTSVEIPSSVTFISIEAFWGCENLDVVIDNSKENIPEEIFRDCKSVKYLK